MPAQQCVLVTKNQLPKRLVEIITGFSCFGIFRLRSAGDSSNRQEEGAFDPMLLCMKCLFSCFTVSSSKLATGSQKGD